MSSPEFLSGLWKPTSFERDGVTWPRQAALAMAHLMFATGLQVPGFHGAWASIRFMSPLTFQNYYAAEEALVEWVTGGKYLTSDLYYFYSGGLFAIRSDRDIDFMEYCGENYFMETNDRGLFFGIYCCNGSSFRLCVPECGQPRPATFDSRNGPNSFLAEYERVADF